MTLNPNFVEKRELNFQVKQIDFEKFIYPALIITGETFSGFCRRAILLQSRKILAENNKLLEGVKE